MASKTKTTERFKLQNVRLAFPNLLVPKVFAEGGNPRFEATFLLDPTVPAHAESIKQMRSAIKALAIAEYGEDIPAEIRSGQNIALKYNAIIDPETKQRTQLKKYNGYADMYFLSTASPAEVVDKKAAIKVAKAIYVPGTTVVDRYLGQPPVIGRQKQPVREGDTEFPYPGCRVNAIVSFWAQPKGGRWGPRINANLVATQFAGDDAPFTRGGIDTDEAFEALEDAPGVVEQKATDGFLD
jgi:hypothetical protein